MAAQPVCAISELNIVIWCIAAMIQVILSSHATFYLVSESILTPFFVQWHSKISSETSAACGLGGSGTLRYGC